MGGPLGLLTLSVLLAITYATPDAAKAKFVVKRFLRAEVERGHFANASIDWVPGKTPEVYFYDKSGKQVEHMYIQHLSFSDLLALMKARGFQHTPGPAAGERKAQSGRQPVNALQAFMRNATSPFTRLHRLNKPESGLESDKPHTSRHSAGTFLGRRMLHL